MKPPLEKEHPAQRRSLLEKVDTSPSYRLFVAVPLWQEFRVGAIRYIDELMRYRWPLRWVKPENWHLTLQFLGDVPVSQVPGLSVALKKAVQKHSPFEIELGEMGGFPRLSKARVLWVGVKRGREPLLELARSAREGCLAGGCPGDKKPFEAHLTLARAKEDPVNIQIQPELFNATWGTHMVDHIALVRSDLQKGGPVYEAIERFGLEG